MRTLALASERRTNVLGAQLTALASASLDASELGALCERLLQSCNARGTQANERYAGLRSLALVACRNSPRTLILTPHVASAVQSASDAGSKQLSSRLASSADARAEFATLLGLCGRSQCVDLESDAGKLVLKHLFAALKDTEAKVVERASLALADVVLGLRGSQEAEEQVSFCDFTIAAGS